MSHDQGIALARQTMHKPHGKPGLDRPSLFAGQDTGEHDAEETQRVRILSTLESSRKPSLPPSRRVKAPQGKGWLPKALISLMVLGGISLLVGFVMVIQQGHSSSVKAPVTPTAMGKASPAMPPQEAATIVKPSEAPAATSAPQPIERNPLQALGAAKLVDETGATETATLPVIRPLATDSTPAPKTQRAAKDNKAEAPAAKTERKQPPTAKHDDDVALLEAMFTHAGPRKAPVSAAEDLRKRCGGMNGTEASACRAKVCAQHPKSPLCRD